jgi:hypothetical protein
MRCQNSINRSTWTGRVSQASGSHWKTTTQPKESLLRFMTRLNRKNILSVKDLKESRSLTTLLTEKNSNRSKDCSLHSQQERVSSSSSILCWESSCKTINRSSQDRRKGATREDFRRRMLQRHMSSRVGSQSHSSSTCTIRVLKRNKPGLISVRQSRHSIWLTALRISD